MKFSNIETDIKNIYDQSNQHSGCSYEIFVQKFSEAIDDALIDVEADIQMQVLEKARRLGYLSLHEISDMVREMREDGSCMHGLDYLTCPCGCFDHDGNVE